MYNSNSMQTIVENPRKSTCPAVIEFINDTCSFYPQCETTAEDVYDHYRKYCKDRNIKRASFNQFAKSFKYYAYHNNMVPNLLIHRVNYTHYKPGVGYVRKQGWAYTGLSVVDKPIELPLYKKYDESDICNEYKTYIPLLLEFIKDTCRYELDSYAVPEAIFETYIIYCRDKGINVNTNFDSFNRAISYWLTGKRIVHSGIFKQKFKYNRDRLGAIGKKLKVGAVFVNLAINYISHQSIFNNQYNTNYLQEALIPDIDEKFYNMPEEQFELQLCDIREEKIEKELVLPSLIQDW